MAELHKQRPDLAPVSFPPTPCARRRRPQRPPHHGRQRADSRAWETWPVRRWEVADISKLDSSRAPALLPAHSPRPCLASLSAGLLLAPYLPTGSPATIFLSRGRKNAMSQPPPPIGVIPQDMMHAQQPTPQPVNYYSDASTTNDLTGGLPINLDSLRDGPPGSKPFYPYSTLIRYVVRVGWWTGCVFVHGAFTLL